MTKYEALQEIDAAKKEGRRANLIGANLSDANLRDADICGADICGADFPSPQMVLMASWGTVSDDLCVELMRYDAASHPEPDLFIEWADGGDCPYEECGWQRAANFAENGGLYAPGPSMRPIELAERVLDEKCPGWRGEDTDK